MKISLKANIVTATFQFLALNNIVVVITSS